MKQSQDKTRLLIADDHVILRMGLVTLFENTPGFAIAGEADDGEQAVRETLRLKPDVVIMDLSMPVKDGIEATREIMSAAPETKILVLTTFATSDSISDVLAAGARGVVLKNIPREQLLSSIRRVVAGEQVLSEDVKAVLAEDPPVAPLSSRQGEILNMLAKGLSNREMAEILGISVTVVKEHITALYGKLGAANRAEAIAIALRKSLLNR